MKPQFQPVPPRTSLYDFCQGVIAGTYDVTDGVKAKVDSGGFLKDAADWAEQLLQEFEAGGNDPHKVTGGASKGKFC